LLEKRQYQVNSRVCAERGIIAEAILEYIPMRVRQGELTATKPHPTGLCIIDTTGRAT
jgi:hypothetical protein